MAPPKVGKGGAKVSFGPPQSGKTKKYWVNWLLANDSDEAFEIVTMPYYVICRDPEFDKNGVYVIYKSFNYS